MLKSKVIIDYSLFERKMGALGTKVIPRAEITVGQIAKYGLRAIRLFTLRAGAGYTEGGQGRGSKYARTSGRKKIADLWRLTHQRKAYMDIYTIKNLYPDQNVVIFFEEGVAEHKIKPKSKKVLHWVDDETGEEIFAPLVHHPGMKETRMAERTEREILQPKIEVWMTETLKMVDRETK